MNRCARYIFAQLSLAGIVVVITITCAVWLTQSLRFIELIVNRGLTVGAYLYLTLLLVPALLATLVPLGLFAAVLFTYNRLNTESELIIMRAVGMGPVQLAWPTVVLSILAVALNYSLTLYFMPVSYRDFKDMEADVRGDYSAIILTEGAFNTVSEGITVYVREREADGGLRGLILHDNRDKDKTVTIMAQHGVLAQTPDGQRLILVDGNRQTLQHDNGKLSILYFDRYSTDLGQAASGGSKDLRWRQPRERFINELFFPGDSELDRQNYNLLQAEAHNRVTSPLYPLTFALLGLSALLSGEHNRRGQGKRILIAVLIMMVVQSGAVAWTGLAARFPLLIPAIYANVLVPMAASIWWLLRTPRRSRRASGPAEALAGAD
ncbi:MAG TPA: LPS export ABC transporter permease LptF [Alphaproteobacteria bacterium]